MGGGRREGDEVGVGRMDDAGATASEHPSVTPTHQHCASSSPLTSSSLSSPSSFNFEFSSLKVNPPILCTAVSLPTNSNVCLLLPQRYKGASPLSPHAIPLPPFNPPHPTCLLSQRLPCSLPCSLPLLPVSTLVRLLLPSSLHIAQLPIEH